MAEDAAAPVDYSSLITVLEHAARQEISHEFTGVSIALIDGDRIVYVNFGNVGNPNADPNHEVTEKTLFRAGSISKLLNAVAVMQLVEQNRIDLDADIREYLPELNVVNPFPHSGPITVRQLLCHRSGLIRESPRGNYFDDQRATLAQTVASLNGMVLVNAPNTTTRYSNIGPSVAGYIVERISKVDFADYQRVAVLQPLNMNNSHWKLRDFAISKDVAEVIPPVNLGRGKMLIARPDGTIARDDAPLFDLGTIPAGNLFTTSEDLAQFARMILNNGRAGDRQILKPESLQEMFKPQLIEGEEGFGLGFRVGKQFDQFTVSHMGAVYGHTSAFTVAPEAGVAVVVLTNGDIVTGPVRKLHDLALEGMFEAKIGRKPQAPSEADALDINDTIGLHGRYQSAGYWAEVSVAINGHIEAIISGQYFTWTPLDKNRLLANGRLAYNDPITILRDEEKNVIGFTAMGQTFERIDPEKMPPLPEEWKKYLGCYGPKFIPIVISERHGQLYAMTENMIDYRLRPVNQFTFAMPPGLYSEEQIVFHVNEEGKAYAIDMASVPLARWKEEGNE